MDAILKSGAVIRLDSQPGEYRIQDVYGRGGSCVAYHAQYTNGTGETMSCLLKEFNPCWLPMRRDGENFLFTERKERFQEGLRRFREGYELQKEIYEDYAMRNQTALPLGLFTGNGTVYTMTELKSGAVYSDTADASLLQTVETLISLTKLIGRYHDAGYLHLDIKPSNILLLSETRDILVLFDFDSVVRKDQASRAMLSYTQDWAAAELTIPSARYRICEATDLYAIGEILFMRVMGRHSKTFERRSFSAYDFKEAVLLQNPDSLLCRKLTEVFRRTLCSSVEMRWQSARELLSALEDLKELAERKFILRSSLGHRTKNFFIGRTRELEDMPKALHGNRSLVLCGMGGIGKSELAKNYAERHLDSGDYDTVLFVPYSASWSETIANDSAISIDNIYKEVTESPTNYAYRKLKQMKALCNSRTLLIIDDLDEFQFDGEEARIWEVVQGLNCPILITSRLNSWEALGKNCMPIVSLAEDDALGLFQRWCDCKLDHRESAAAKQIIKFLGHHPLAVELTAKYTAASDYTPSEVYAKLTAEGVHALEAEPVYVEKDGLQLYQSGFTLVRTVLRLVELSALETGILRAAALFPPEGIDRRGLKVLCGLQDNREINRLIDYGWLSIQDKQVAIHPLVADVVLANGLSEEEVNRFFQNLNILWDGTTEVSEGPFDEEFTRYFIAERYAQSAFWQIRRHVDDVHPSAICAKRYLAKLYLNWGKHMLAIDEYLYAGWCLDQAAHWSEESVELHILRGDVLYAMRPQIWDARQEPEEHQRAVDCYREALAVPGHPASSEQRITALDQLGKLYTELVQCDDAERCLKAAITLSVETFGEDHETTAECWMDLGKLYFCYGDPETAEQAFQRAIRICEALGPDASWIVDNIRFGLKHLFE